ncbi:Na(+)-translocating NADH-quinone reductase subunit C [Thalassolituus marinus]|uniref:Na(+)-translocating NADH-quinone reductase subunit C n=1 Tax=Thalassolituus marinus TaxID=671053 RepID=A0ABS7ZQJ5_9GAMM|nr:Na(+)-translocating NADH-quinone reductase subunit C [Thalassolituus marinus]MCA6063997.1 Na(+)-translocating NADH-quinone reductase subunit C [Thalassolituus marinus]
MSANNDSIQKTLLVAILLCLVCSVIVAGSAVGLRKQQNENKANDKKVAVLQAAGMYDSTQSVAEQFSRITTRIVNLEEGRFVNDAELAEIKAAGLDPNNYDQKKASKTPALSNTLSGSEDIASIKRQAKYASVYILESDGQIDTIILPVHGYGLWSTLYGFLALKGDLETIEGLGFYSHAETPGLGGEVDNPKWKALWTGKKLHNANGDLAISVVKGGAEAGNLNQVDGLSGATLTSRGVDSLVKFWVGDTGFGKFLTYLKEQGA